MRRLFSAMPAWASKCQELLWALMPVLLGLAVWFLVFDADQRDAMRVPFVLAGSGTMLTSWWGCVKVRRATAKDLQKVIAMRDSAAEDLSAAQAHLNHSQTMLAASLALHRASAEFTSVERGQ